jgi:hypothetical protein
MGEVMHKSNTGAGILKEAKLNALSIPAGGARILRSEGPLTRVSRSDRRQRIGKIPMVDNSRQTVDQPQRSVVAREA